MSVVCRRVVASMSVLGAAVFVSTSCAHPTTFVVDGPVGSDAKVIVEDRYYEPSDGRVVVPVQPGDEPVQWRIEQGIGGPVVGEGTVERTDVEWPVIVAGTCLAACGIPSCAFAGFLLANPAVPAVPVEALFNNPAAAASFQSPTWTTIPFMAGGAVIGALPLLLATVAQSPPDTVRIVAGPVVDTPAVKQVVPQLPNPPPPAEPSSSEPAPPPSSTPSSSEDGNPAGPLLQNSSGMSF